MPFTLTLGEKETDLVARGERRLQVNSSWLCRDVCLEVEDILSIKFGDIMRPSSRGFRFERRANNAQHRYTYVIDHYLQFVSKRPCELNEKKE